MRLPFKFADLHVVLFGMILAVNAMLCAYFLPFSGPAIAPFCFLSILVGLNPLILRRFADKPSWIYLVANELLALALAAGVAWLVYFNDFNQA